MFSTTALGAPLNRNVRFRRPLCSLYLIQTCGSRIWRWRQTLVALSASTSESGKHALAFPKS